MIDIHALHGVLSFAGYVSLYAFCGLVIARVWLVPAPAFDLAEAFPRWRQMLGECFAMLAFSGVSLLLVRVSEMDDGPLPTILADLPTVAVHTHFGHVWTLHLLTLALIWRGCKAQTRPEPSFAWGAFMLAALLVLAFTYSASSHASDGGDFTLAELNDWVHLASTATWGGAIMISVLFVFPLLREQHSLAAVAASRLSVLATVALPFALASGLYNAWLQVRNPAELLGSAYGLVLGGKVAAVAVVTLLGALNRFVIVPRIRRLAFAQGAGADASGAASPLRLIFAVLAVDASFVLFAIVMAAILVQNEAV